MYPTTQPKSILNTFNLNTFTHSPQYIPLIPPAQYKHNLHKKLIQLWKHLVTQSNTKFYNTSQTELARQNSKTLHNQHNQHKKLIQSSLNTFHYWMRSYTWAFHHISTIHKLKIIITYNQTSMHKLTYKWGD